MDIISLSFLFFTIALGLLKKINIGLIGMGLSLVLAKMGNISESEVLLGFPTSTFINIFGVTFWFSIVSQTGVIELVGKKLVLITGSKQWIIPFLLMTLGFCIAYVGPGGIPALLLCVMCISLALEVNAKPLLYIIPTFLGVCAGRFSVFSPEGLWLETLGKNQGYTELISYFTLCNIIASLLGTIICFLYYRGWQKNPHQEKISNEKFNKNQIMSILSVIVLIILIIGFRLNSALSCMFIGTILMTLGVAKEKDVIYNMPFGTMILVCGMGMFVLIVKQLGGIELLSAMLNSFILPDTASTIMGFISAVMGAFSSSFGVVYPTLMPTVPEIVSNFGNDYNGVSILYSISYGASITGISPFSTAGSLCLASIILNKRIDSKQKNNYYKAFLGWTVFFILFTPLLSFINLFDFISILFYN